MGHNESAKRAVEMVKLAQFSKYRESFVQTEKRNKEDEEEKYRHHHHQVKYHENFTMHIIKPKKGLYPTRPLYTQMIGPLFSVVRKI